MVERWIRSLEHTYCFARGSGLNSWCPHNSSLVCVGREAAVFAYGIAYMWISKYIFGGSRHSPSAVGFWN